MYPLRNRSRLPLVLGLVLITTIVFPTLTIAANSSDKQAYQTAAEFVKHGKLEKALSSLNNIEQLFPQAIYLKGQIEISLKKWRSAELTFSNLKKNNDWQYIAKYYLALIAESKSKTKTALNYYLDILNSNAPEKLKSKSQLSINRIKNIKNTNWKINSQVTASILLNNSEIEDTATTKKQEAGRVLNVFSSAQFDKHGLYGFIYDRTQNETNYFDVLQLGGGYEYNFGEQRISIGLTNIDSPSSNYAQYSAAYKINLKLKHIERVSAYINHYSPRNEFNYLSGERYGVNVIGYFSPKINWSYLVYKDERADIINNDYSDYSPFSNSLSLEYTSKFKRHSFSASVRYEYQNWMSSDYKAYGSSLTAKHSYPFYKNLHLDTTFAYDSWREYTDIRYREKTITFYTGFRYLF